MYIVTIETPLFRPTSSAFGVPRGLLFPHRVTKGPADVKFKELTNLATKKVDKPQHQRGMA